MYEAILSPVDYGGIILKNRIIFAPTTMGLSRDAFLTRLRQIARGGCAMIIIGDVPASPWSVEPSLYKEEGFAYYAQLADAVHTRRTVVSVRSCICQTRWQTTGRGESARFAKKR